MSSSKKAANKAKSKVMARSSAKEKTKSGKAGKSARQDTGKDLKPKNLKPKSLKPKSLKPKSGADVKAGASRSVVAIKGVGVKGKGTKKPASNAVAAVKAAKTSVAPSKAAVKARVAPSAKSISAKAVTAKAVTGKVVSPKAVATKAVTAKSVASKSVAGAPVAKNNAKIQTNLAVSAAGSGKHQSQAVKPEENKRIVKKSQQIHGATSRKEPAPVDPSPAKHQVSAKPILSPDVSAAAPAKSPAPAKREAPVTAAVMAKSLDAKEAKASTSVSVKLDVATVTVAKPPVAQPAADVAKPAASASRPVVAKEASGAPRPVASPMQSRPGMHSSRSPFGVRAPFPPIVRPADPRGAGGGKPGASPKTGFKTNEYIVYPAHGVGQIIATEEQEVAGYKLELFVISFFKDKLTLKVPLPKVLSGAIRKLSDGPTVQKALDTLTGRARVKRTMWSRRAQEYEAKINSGDLAAIAEVVRDLYRSEAQPEQSYSERQLYEAALDRMGREVAVVQKLTETESLKLIEQHLEKGPRRGTRSESEAAGEVERETDVAASGEIEAAA